MEWDQRVNDIKNVFYFYQSHFFSTFGQLAYVIPPLGAWTIEATQKEENEVWLGELAMA